MEKDELEKDVAELKKDVKSIMENHLPTLAKAIGKLGTKFAYQAGILAVVLILMSVILAWALGVI